MIVAIAPFFAACTSPRLKDANLSQVLPEAQQLPSGIQLKSPAELDADALRYFSAMRGVQQDIVSTGGDRIGWIRVLLIPSQAKRTSAFSFLSNVETQEGIIPHEYPKVGEISVLFATERSITVVFVRCEAVTDAYLDRRGTDTEDAELLWSLASQIDMEITRNVCPLPTTKVEWLGMNHSLQRTRPAHRFGSIIVLPGR
jgi:hypothetical protein